MSKRSWQQSVITAVALGLGLAACNGITQRVPFETDTQAYTYADKVAIPGIPPASPAAFAFGISTLSATDGDYYLADRTLGGIDVVDLASMTYQRTAGTGAFAGNVTKPANAAGPNGLVAVGGGVVFAGDGNADVVVVDTVGGSALATVKIPNTKLRVDLLGYDPTDHVVIANSDANVPPVATLISSVAPYGVLKQVTFSNATGGINTATYDPNQGVFLESVIATATNPNGELDLVNPTTGAIASTIPFGSKCNPYGTAVGPGDRIAVSCGRDPKTSAPQVSVVIDGASGAVLGTYPKANGCDQTWFDPNSARFFFACDHAVTGKTNTPNISVVDANTLQMVTTIATSSGTSSVAVAPGSGHLFVPQSSSKIGLNVYTFI